MGSRLYASILQEPVIILASTVQRASREAAYSGGRGAALALREGIGCQEKLAKECHWVGVPGLWCECGQGGRGGREVGR